MTNRKTPRMLAAEVGRGLMEQWLPAMIEVKGLSGTAKVLSISRRTLRDWCLILGLRFERRLVQPATRDADAPPIP